MIEGRTRYFYEYVRPFSDRESRAEAGFAEKRGKPGYEARQSSQTEKENME